MADSLEAPSSPSEGTGISFDEIERQLKDAEASTLRPDLSKIILDSDDAPDLVKGKSVQDALAHVRNLETALRASEQGRQEAMLLAQANASRASAPPAPPAPEPEPEITAEMVAEAFQEDSTKGIALMQRMNQQAIERAAEHFGKRLEPLIAGSSSAAENQARQKYPDEFELYKDEIAETLKQIPNKQVMSTAKSWDELIAYVRGKDPMKLFNHMNAREAKKHEESARVAERANVGFQAAGSSSMRTPVSQGSVAIDETTKEICSVLGVSPEDYIKWSRVR